MFKIADDELSAKVRAVQDQEMAVTKATADVDALKYQLREAEQQRDDAADDSDRKKYDKLAAEVERVTKELEFADARLRKTNQKLATAKAELAAANNADRRKTGERFCDQRTKAVEKIGAGIAMFNEGWRELHGINGKIATWAGASLIANHGGTLTASDEALHALTIELARVSSPGVLPPPGALPALPGSASFIFGGNPSESAPLTELIAKANDELMRRLTAAPTPEPTPEPPKPASQPVQADDAALQQPAPTSEPVSAEQIMATVGRRKLA